MKLLSFEMILYLFIFSALSLIWVPSDFLLDWFWGIRCLLVCSGLVGVAYYYRVDDKIKCLLLYLMFLLLSSIYVHSYPIQLLKLADNVAHLPKQVETKIKIIEILHQQDYQSAIATATLSSDLPEQRIFIQWKLSEKIKLGQVWKANLRLRPISSRLNQGGFDKQQWYFSKGITAWASVKSAVKIQQDFSLRAMLLERAFIQTESLSAQGLLLALAFGERAWLSSLHKQIYQRTNTAHLIAISGLHIGLAMGIGFLLGRGMQYFLSTRLISPYFPLFIGLLIAGGYALLAGLAIPTQRAFIALSFVFLLRLSRLHYSAWQLFFRIVAILLFYDPLMCLSSSFWLSLGAVISLIIWYQLFPLSLLHWRGKPLEQSVWRKVRWLLSLFHLQIGLFFLFAPVQLLMFGGISWGGLFANLIAVPLYSFILVPIILFTLVTQNYFITWRWANVLVEQITQWLSYLTEQWLQISTWQTYLIIVFLTSIFILFLRYTYLKIVVEQEGAVLTRPKGFHLALNDKCDYQTIKVTFSICGMLICSLFGYISYQIYQEPDWRLETIDVGQGLAMLVVKNGRGILYDTGASWNGGSMAELELLPYLLREGLKIDKLILSHDDNDHSGGVKTILTQFPDIEFVTPSFRNYGKKDRTFCIRGQQWQWQGLDFKVLSPFQIVQRAKNEHSCVLLISDGQYSVLLMGDADVDVEKQLLFDLPLIDVLQVGHHGSKTSTSEALLTQINPKIALISSGRWNAWGFPHQVVNDRLNIIGADVYNTAHTGQISIKFYKNKLKIALARTKFIPWYRRLIGLQTKSEYNAATINY
ncbi:protein Rec2 [Pasteurella dagmatis]|nr:protein Rec2 [Pasteurella dagmatis]